jgi:hypothetical protein
MTQAADGHVAVVTGRMRSIATVKKALGPTVLSVQPDQIVHSLGVGGHENDPMRRSSGLDRRRSRRRSVTRPG